MSRATSRLRDLAQHLIAAEARVVNAPADTKTPRAFLVCERLRPHLANLMGSGGFHALLSRSLALARAKVDWLHAVALTGDTLGVSEEVGKKVGAEVMAEGGAVLISELLGLLVAFIGERLMLQIVRETWPNLSLHNLDSGGQS